MHLTVRRVAGFLVAAVAIGVGAYLLGHGGADQTAVATVPTTEGPQPMHLPQLTAVAPLPGMRKPPQPRHPAEKEAGGESEEFVGEESASVESFPEETYEAPVEETGSSTAESSGPTEEASSAPTEASHESTEPSPSTGGGGGGGGEELVGEG